MEGTTVSVTTAASFGISSGVRHVSMSTRGVWYCIVYILWSRTYPPVSGAYWGVSAAYPPHT